MTLARSTRSPHYGLMAGGPRNPARESPAISFHREAVVKPDRARILAEGLITGLIGGLVVILFYGFLNLVTDRSFFATAALLGAGLVSTARAGGAVGAVLAFNGVHVIAFLVIGVAAAWLVLYTERHPTFVVLALFAGVAGLFVVMAAFLSFAADSGVQIPIGSVFAANLLAGAAMGAYLLRAHPRLWAEIRDHLDSEEEHPVPR